MKIRLIRYGNLFDPRFWRITRFALPLIVVLFLVKEPIYAFSISFFVLVGILLAPFEYPKSFTADYEKITFIAPYYLKNKYGRGGRNIKVRYEITHITEIELSSNRFERLFGLAHLEFTGYTTYDAGKYTDRIEPKYRHSIYGISLKKHKDAIDDFIKSVKTL